MSFFDELDNRLADELRKEAPIICLGVDDILNQGGDMEDVIASMKQARELLGDIYPIYSEFMTASFEMKIISYAKVELKRRETKEPAA